MVQAARSGVQNIAEGSKASGTSKKMELKLTNVARASLEELKLDYEDFLRQRGLVQWTKEDPRRLELIRNRCTSADEVAEWIREEWRRQRAGPDGQSGRRHSGSGLSTESIPSTYAEVAANAALVLIGVACSLLDRQVLAQAKAFLDEGGFTERLYKIRSRRRGR
jgi:four helix bundle suffix protein